MDYRWLSSSVLFMGLAGCFADPPSVGEAGSTTETSTTAPSTSTGTSATRTGTGQTTVVTTADATTSTGTPDTSTSGSTTVQVDTGAETTAVDVRPQDPCAESGRTVFINFDGVLLTDAEIDDATLDEVRDGAAARNWSMYTLGDNDDILIQLGAIFDPYDICITDSRPGAGDYDMAVVTSDDHPVTPGLFVVFGPEFANDCDDSEGAGNVMVTTFGGSNIPSAARAVGIAGAIGITLGLELVTNGPNEVMQNVLTSSSGNRTFVNACYELDLTPCEGLPGCPAGQQNSHAYLTEKFPTT